MKSVDTYGKLTLVVQRIIPGLIAQINNQSLELAVARGNNKPEIIDFEVDGYN